MAKAELLKEAQALGLDVTEKNTVSEIEAAVKEFNEKAGVEAAQDDQGIATQGAKTGAPLNTSDAAKSTGSKVKLRKIDADYIARQKKATQVPPVKKGS